MAQQTSKEEKKNSELLLGAKLKHLIMTNRKGMNLDVWMFLFWCDLSGLQEELGQHDGGRSCGWDLLQVMLRQEIWAQRLRLRGRSRHSEYGQRRRTWNQAWTVRAAALPLVISTAKTKLSHTKTVVPPSQVPCSLPVLDFPQSSPFFSKQTSSSPSYK